MKTHPDTFARNHSHRTDTYNRVDAGGNQCAPKGESIVRVYSFGHAAKTGARGGYLENRVVTQFAVCNHRVSDVVHRRWRGSQPCGFVERWQRRSGPRACTLNFLTLVLDAYSSHGTPVAFRQRPTPLDACTKIEVRRSRTSARLQGCPSYNPILCSLFSERNRKIDSTEWSPCREKKIARILMKTRVDSDIFLPIRSFHIFRDTFRYYYSRSVHRKIIYDIIN